MDAALHFERLDGRSKRTHALPGSATSLPSGVFVTDGATAFLVHDAQLLAWSPAGYTTTTQTDQSLRLLTPPSIMRAIIAGFVPHMAVDF